MSNEFKPEGLAPGTYTGILCLTSQQGVGVDLYWAGSSAGFVTYAALQSGWAGGYYLTAGIALAQEWNNTQVGSLPSGMPANQATGKWTLYVVSGGFTSSFPTVWTATTYFDNQNFPAYGIGNGAWNSASSWLGGVVPTGGNIVLMPNTNLNLTTDPTLLNFGSLTLLGGSTLVNNPGNTIAALPSGWVLNANAGTITTNWGVVETNTTGGTITTNYGTVQANYAAVGTNASNNSQPTGEILCNVGTVTTNQAGASIVYNAGTVTTNNGLIEYGTGSNGGSTNASNFTGAFPAGVVANCPTGPTYNVSGIAPIGAITPIPLQLQQFMAGNLPIPVVSSMSGKNLTFAVTSALNKTTVLWTVTNSNITVSGNGLVCTVAVPSTDTQTSPPQGWYWYLVDETDHLRVGEGPLTLDPGPNA